jgi:DNA-binding NtrC family response regulator
MPSKPHYRLPGEAIFIVAPAEEDRFVLRRQLFRLGPGIHVFASGEELLPVVRPGDIGCVLIRADPQGADPIGTLNALRLAAPAMTSVVILPSQQIDLAPEASRAGAFEMLLDPVESGRLREAVSVALAASRERAGRSSGKTAP